MKKITNNDLLDKILENNIRQNKNAQLDMFILQHREAILEALQMNIPIKTIYNTILSEIDIKACYNTFLRKINNLKSDFENNQSTYEK